MPIGRLKRMFEGRAPSLSKAGPSPVAIDFGVGSLKVLQVVPGEPPSLVGAACLVTPEHLLEDHAKRLQFQVDQLPGLIRKGGFKGKRAVCAVPASMAFCKHMQLPRTEGASMKSLIEAALPTQLGRPAHQVVFRYVEAPPPERGVGKSEVVVTAVGRELVSQMMEGVKAARLEPVGIHGQFQAIIRAFDYMYASPEEAEHTTLYLDIGAGTTNCVIAHGQRLAFTRDINIGGLALDQTVAKQLKLSFEEACKTRRELIYLTASEAAAARDARPAEPAPNEASDGSGAEGVSAGGTAVAPARTAQLEDLGLKRRGGNRGPDPDLTEALEIMGDEVAMCLRYHGSLYPSRKIDRAIFVGGEARSRPLCQHLAKALRLPAQVADPMARVARASTSGFPNVDLTQAQPGWTVPLGLCLCPTDL
ncbi:MAG: pilus assembly protein PilM [Phycisphaerales bacterium]|nr:pilus assembly protein PilM [Phycisphaerales bacterium]MCB9841428.1 pilus assembly protein PilM [Phycisphaeraceae bacterium]